MPKESFTGIITLSGHYDSMLFGNLKADFFTNSVLLHSKLKDRI